MAAYLVDITNINDEEPYAAYRARVSPELEVAGGQYLVRGGTAQLVPGATVIGDFNTVKTPIACCIRVGILH